MFSSFFNHTHSVTRTPPFPYTVKVSKRAKSARLKMSPHGGLVVVLPEGFNKKHIPDLLHRHEAWIKKAAGRLELHRPEPLPLTENGLPCTIRLAHLDDEWRVVYNSKGRGVVEVADASGAQLLLSADVDNAELSRRQLLSGLKRQATGYLIPSFEKLAASHDFRYSEVLVRLQHSRWGSCSSRGIITLNTKLLFLPDYLVRYIMIHELCHTVHLNHSKAFWTLVSHHDPLWRSNNLEMKSAWKYVPPWVAVSQ